VNETILLTNMRDDQLAKRLAEAKEGRSHIEAGCRIIIAVASPTRDQPLRLGDAAAFEIRSAIGMEITKHIADIEDEIQRRQELRK
jgi:hypothetical protein